MKTTKNPTWPWRIRIDDGFGEYEYTLKAQVHDVSIRDLYVLVRDRLKAKDVEGRFVKRERDSS